MKEFPDHIQWLIDRKGTDLSAALKTINIDLTVKQVMKIFMDADPSQGKKAVDWITNTFLNGGFLWEDVEAGVESKVLTTLESFALFRTQLSAEKRNLSQYTRLSHLYEAIKIFEQPEKNDITGKERKRKEKAEVIDQTTVISRTDQRIIAVPLTRKASEWWGRGTQWCTAASKSQNYFDSYNEDGPLIIVLCPNGLPSDPKHQIEKDSVTARKFQLWTNGLSYEEGGQFYFMDENDTPVDGELVRNNWDFFAPIIEWVAEHNQCAKAYFPSAQLGEDEIIKLIKLNTKNLEIIDPQTISYNAYMALLQAHPEMVRKVPSNIMDQNLANMVLNKSAQHYIEYIPKKYQDKNACLKALNYSLHLSEVINFDLLAEEDIFNILNTPDLTSMKISASECKSLFHNLTDELRSSRILLALVSANASCFERLEKHEVTQENVLAALNKNANLLNKIPVEFINDEVAQLLARQNPGFLKLLPSHLINNHILSLALEQDRARYADWQWIPKELLTRDICIKILIIGEDFWENIPKNLIDQDFCTEVFDKNSDTIEYMPHEFINPLWWKRAVMQTHYLLRKMPVDLHTEELYLQMLKGKDWNPAWDDFLPSALTERICLAMIDNHPTALKVIPEEMQTIEMCRQAVEKLSTVIKYVAPKLKKEIEEYFASVDINAHSNQSILESNPVVGQTFYSRRTIAQQDAPAPAAALSVRLWEDSFLKGLVKKLEDSEYPVISEDQTLTS